jgi:hypothetical protein
MPVIPDLEEELEEDITRQATNKPVNKKTNEIPTTNKNAKQNK